MAGATWNCCSLGSVLAYTIEPCTSLQCHFIQSHIDRVHVCLAVTCHLQFRCCGNTEVERTPKYESAQKVDPGEEHSPGAPARIRTRHFWSRVWRCNHWAIPAQDFYFRCFRCSVVGGREAMNHSRTRGRKGRKACGGKVPTYGRLFKGELKRSSITGPLDGRGIQNIHTAVCSLRFSSSLLKNWHLKVTKKARLWVLPLCA